MRFCVTGASGFLGSALVPHLRSNGHDVVRLVRRDARAADESSWEPSEGRIDDAVIDRCDVVINLAGASFIRWPWTSRYKEKIMRSRVDSTRTIASAVARSTRKPALLSGSGVNRYGDDRGDEVLDETSSSGHGFLAEVVEAWESATRVAADAGVRVCQLRTAAALHRSGGPFGAMSIPFRLGLGGRVGSGEQYFSCLSRTDWLRAVEFLAGDDTAEGPYNLCAPDPPTNAELTAELASQLGRPAIMAAPRFAVEAVVGEMGSLLLGSLRVVPRRLLDAGFEFRQPDLPSIVAAALH